VNKFSSLISGIAGAAALGFTVSVPAFAAPGGHHHGSAALMACMAAAPKSVKQSLWPSIKSSSLQTDRETLRTAQQNLSEQILAKNTSLSSYETAVSQAQLKLLQDDDALAQNVCGQLSATQLSAASTLYTNLQTNRQTMKGYFATARQASGDQPSGQSDSNE